MPRLTSDPFTPPADDESAWFDDDIVYPPEEGFYFHGVPSRYASRYRSRDITDVHLPGDQPKTRFTMTDMLAVGGTYRQLGYWTQRGWLTPAKERPSEPGVPVDTDKSGYHHIWSTKDYVTWATMLLLVNAGFTAGAAHRIARGNGHLSHVIVGDGVSVSWRPITIPPEERAPDAPTQ